MATSSIFAKIELKDPERVRAFVDALCSDKPWPQPRPTVHAVHMTSDEWKDFFARGPYGKKAALAKFYAENGFALFGSRDDVENGKPITYDQLFLFLR